MTERQLQDSVQTISNEEFDAAGQGQASGAGYPNTKYSHIYYAVRRLLSKDEVLKVSLIGIDRKTASKKAHTYAKPYGLEVHCKTFGDYLYVRRRMAR